MKLVDDHNSHRLMPFENFTLKKQDVFENFEDKKNEKLASISFTKDFARSNLFSLGTNQ